MSVWAGGAEEDALLQATLAELEEQQRHLERIRAEVRKGGGEERQKARRQGEGSPGQFARKGVWSGALGDRGVCAKACVLRQRSGRETGRRGGSEARGEEGTAGWAWLVGKVRERFCSVRPAPRPRLSP